MKKKHPHQAAIQIRPGFFLDPNPALAHAKLQRRDFAQRELQSALGNTLTMARLRQLLPGISNSLNKTDQDVIDAIATMVGLGQATLKFSIADAGDLPWPDILHDLGRPEFEGTVKHMYLDSFGKITVGVGTMLASVAEAQELGFVVRATGVDATEEQIAADYAKVGGQVKNRIASSYKSDLDLPQEQIDRVLKIRAERSAQQLAARYRGWDKYPVEVKRALIDMRYNMNNNMDKFVNFQAAIEKAAQTNVGQDWKDAADESERRAPVSDVRNDWTSAMILRGGGVIK